MLVFIVSVLTLTAAVAFILAIYAWRMRPAKGAAAFACLMLSLVIWSLGQGLELAIPLYEIKILLAQVEYLGIVALPASWLILSLQYSGFDGWLKPRSILLLAIEPILVLSLVWTSGAHGLFWSDLALEQTGFFPVLSVSYGPFFWLHTVYSYIVLLIGAILLGRTFMLAPHIYRGQVVIFLICLIIPWAGNLFYLLDLGIFRGVDLTPVAFSLISPILAFGVFRLHILDLVPVAYSTLVEGMNDGLIVFDSQKSVYYLNPAAESIIGCSLPRIKGSHLSELPIAIPIPPQDVADIQDSREKTVTTLTIKKPLGMEYYQVNVSPIKKGQAPHDGWVVILSNITHHKAAVQALHRRAEEIAALGATLLDIAANQDLQTLLQDIVARAVRLLETSGGSLFKTDPDRRELTCLVSHSFPSNPENQVLEYGKDAAGKVAESGKPLLIGEYSNWPGKITYPFEAKKVTSLLSVPLTWRTQVLGVLNVIHTEPGLEFTQDDLELLLLFANQAALALANSRLFEAEQRRAQEAETLRQAAASVAGTLNPDEAIERILEQLARVAPCDSASVQLLRDGFLEIVGGRGWSDLSTVVGGRFTVPGNNPNTRVVLERRPLIVTEELDDYPSFRRKTEKSRIRSWLGVPLIVHDRVIGILAMDSRQGELFQEQHARLAAAFADQVAITMENARLYAEAQQQAEELSRLYTAAQDLGASLEPTVVLSQLARHLTQALNTTSGRILELNQETDEYTVLAEYASEDALPEERASCIGINFAIQRQMAGVVTMQSAEPISYHVHAPLLSDEERRRLMDRGVKSILVVPIVAGGRILGAASLWESRRHREFSPTEKRLSQALAQHGAGVIENAQLYNAVRKRVNEMDALRATLADLSSELELSRLLHAIIQRAVSMLDATGGDLGIFDEATGEMAIVVSYNMGKDYTGTRMLMGEGAMGCVAESLEPIIIHNYQEWEGRSPHYERGPFHAVLAVPLLIGGKLVGSLGIMDTSPTRQFNLADQHLITLFAQQAAIAIKNARLYQKATQAADRRAILHEVSQEIVTARLDPQAIYAAIHKAAAKIMPTEAFVITFMENDDENIEAVFLVDQTGELPPFSFPIGQGASSYIIATGRSLIVDDLNEFDAIEPVHFTTNKEVKSILAAPIRMGGKVKGMLSCQSYTPKAYNEEDLSLLEMLAVYTGIALDNARLFREVQQLAVTDPLTGISNRRKLFDLGQREFKHAQRYKNSLAVVMLDVDNFKALNDTYGHRTGDDALIYISKNLQQNIRDIDILARYGGDEFVIILPETDAQAAEKIGQRLIDCISKAPLQSEYGPIPLSISLGYAVLSEQTPTLESLLGQADRAMYAAKEVSRKKAFLK